MKKKKSSPLCSSSIEVPVNNIVIKVLVNTGAAISLIHETTLHNMKHKPIDTCSLKEVHIANGGFISLIGLVHLNVQLNHFNTGVNVYVTWDLVCSMLLSQVG
ncbi:unnamed protein product [Rotaria magnacalcarata]|uniref:Peptidase A2 domain-containing protein n=1 Tax=Rotaria magnacalcarata TaxID=392030 RepID=A0A816TGU3_9BILA|nr:unnamed protein product [Rotaria magnacalcarata]CAF1656004.1 unnamed protein product [Rotaria magnacalcarata]CAF2096299.1 unnamed protein product [Rotaria magnacalcarata]CAF4740368.1 unnamed protein product [Rotaria magnacalcarata]CAF4744536.1 unnamed protein product [Rotaria magnacalcarata]